MSGIPSQPEQSRERRRIPLPWPKGAAIDLGRRALHALDTKARSTARRAVRATGNAMHNVRHNLSEERYEMRYDWDRTKEAAGRAKDKAKDLGRRAVDATVKYSGIQSYARLSSRLIMNRYNNPDNDLAYHVRYANLLKQSAAGARAAGYERRARKFERQARGEVLRAGRRVERDRTTLGRLARFGRLDPTIVHGLDERVGRSVTFAHGRDAHENPVDLLHSPPLDLDEDHDDRAPPRLDF